MLKVNLQELAKNLGGANITEFEEQETNDIAIIGMAAKLPMAQNPNEFWANLKAGRDCITDLPPERKAEAELYLKFAMPKAGPLKFKKGSYLNQADEFDCRFFNISPREASLMDPNQRLFLETAWSAIEDAGYGGDQLRGSLTGVFFGFVSDLAYQRFIAAVEPAALGMSIPGNMASVIPGRVSYVLDLKGPSILIDTACSSALVAVHSACNSIRNGECDLAIAGSSKMILLPLEDENMLGIESKTYICRAFDNDSDGTCMGEGVMALLLKPLAKAVKDQDNIYAVIKGSWVNQDGSSMGITAPNALAQAEVIEKAWKNAGIAPETVTYIETHGTGTILGDPVEIDGISKAFSKYTANKQFCAVGSVKTNLGHLDSAAGMVGLMKAVLALKNRQIPPTLHFQTPNRNIDFHNSPVFVNDRLLDWKTDGSPRRCGVSAFGLSGTNCHVILEEPPELGSKTTEEPLQILALSAKTAPALHSLVQNYLFFLKGFDGSISDLCYTANTGRGHYQYRLAIIFQTRDELYAKLLQAAENPPLAGEQNGIYYGEFNVATAAEKSVSVITDAELKKITELADENVSLFSKADAKDVVLKEICSLYIKGAGVDFNGFYETGNTRKISLPTYPFEKRRCWLELPVTAPLPSGPRTGEESLGEPASQGVQSGSISNAAPRPAVTIQGKMAGDTTDTEKQLAQIWGETLGFGTIDLGEDFSELGVDSLIAQRLVQRINLQFNRDLKVPQLLGNPTIQRLAVFLDQQTQPQKPESFPIPPLLPLPEQESYRLSAAQKRVYFIEQLSQPGTSYNMPVAVRIEGPLAPLSFERIFRKIIARHEALRTSFQLSAGEPVQIIHPECDFSLAYLETEEKELQAVLANLIKPFDLSRAPLFRAALVKTAPNSHILFYDLHHIIADGFSEAILLREFKQLYRGEEPPALTIQYKDYAEWSQHLLETAMLKTQEQYWLHQYSGPIPVLNMPLDYLRPELQSFHGDSIEFTLPEELVAHLKRLAQNQRTTLNSVLLALYALLTAKYSGQPEVIIGSLVAGRRAPSLESVIGMFVNFLPLKFQITPEATVTDYLQASGRMVLEAYENQDYPFDRLIEKIAAKLDRSRNPLFDTVFIFHNEFSAEDNQFKAGDLNFSSFELIRDSSTLDFKVDAYVNGSGGLRCVLEYNTALFTRKTMGGFIKHFQLLLGLPCAEPELPVGLFELFTVEEKLEVEAKRKLNSDTLEPIGVAISATFTSEPVADYIRWWGRQFQLDVNLRFAPYNQVFQELLNPESLMGTNQGLNLWLIRFEDWIRNVGGSECDQYQQLEESFENLIRAFGGRPVGTPCLVGVFPVATHLSLSPEMTKFLQNMNRRWVEALKGFADVTVIDFTDLDKLYGIREIFDAKKDQEGHLPFSDEFYAALGTIIARKICSFRRTPFKVIVVDCDNTLWKGICGEDGELGVIVDDNFAALQRMLQEKVDSGMLLALCSKNNEPDVWNVFEKNPGMILRREQLVGWRINWGPKSENLKSLARELNLGLDSFIFIDDSPVECAQVMEECPAVLTLQLPADSRRIPSFLKHVWALDIYRVTEEDRNRTQMYVTEKKRQAAQRTTLSMAEFIKSLQLKMSLNLMNRAQLSRVAQLTQRTNQFNLSTIRRTEAEIEALLANPGVKCWVVEVMDKFGDYGLVGVLITREQGRELFLDTFLLSCRVLGRGVEKAILYCLGKYGREIQAETVTAHFYPTAKNQPFLEFLGQTGWEKLSSKSLPTEFTVYQLKIAALLENGTGDDALIECYYLSEYPRKRPETEIKGVDHPPDHPPIFQETAAGADTEAGPEAESWGINIPNRENMWRRNYYLALEYHTGQSLLKLPAFQASGKFSRAEYVAPTTPMETRMAEIWQEILGTEQVGINDNFFGLGGNSIKAASLVARIYKDFNRDLSLTDIFNAPTIQQLATRLAGLAPKTWRRIEPAPAQADYPPGYYPASSAQKRLYLLDQFLKTGTTYNQPLAMLIEGPLSEQKVVSVFQKLTERHEALRTSFEIIGGEPVQRIHSEVDSNLEGEDSNPRLQDSNPPLQSIIRAFIRPFDISVPPLFRVGLFKVSGDRHILICDMSHIISDGTSLIILITEFIHLYNGGELPGLRIQYKDYAVWQSQFRRTDGFKKQEQYWLAQFSGEIPVLKLPTDFPRPAVQSFEGARLAFQSGPELGGGLYRLIRETQTTLFMVLLAVFNVLLAKYSGQEEIIVGSPIAGRNGEDLEKVIGVFVNTLALRNHPQKNKTFRDFLAAVKETCLKAYENQDYPLDELVDRLQLARDPSRNPLFDTVFVLQRNDIPPTQIQGLKFSQYEIPTITSKFDLTLQAEAAPEVQSAPENASGAVSSPKVGNVNFGFEYRTRLFRKETMERMSKDFLKILESVLHDSNIRIKDIKLASEFTKAEKAIQEEVTFDF